MHCYVYHVYTGDDSDYTSEPQSPPKKIRKPKFVEQQHEVLQAKTPENPRSKKSTKKQEKNSSKTAAEKGKKRTGESQIRRCSYTVTKLSYLPSMVKHVYIKWIILSPLAYLRSI